MDAPQTSMRLLQKIRRGVASFYTSDDFQSPEINPRGAGLIAMDMPDLGEVTRLGNSYVSWGTTVAPVAAVPTTAAHFVLWNGEQAGGKSYFIEEVGTILDVTAAAVIVLGLLGMLNKGAQTNPAGSVTISSLSGRGGGYGGNGNTKASVAVTNDGWFPIGQPIVCAGTANISLGLVEKVRGGIIIPPGGLFSLATLCSAAGTATARPYIKWNEIQTVVNPQ